MRMNSRGTRCVSPVIALLGALLLPGLALAHAGHTHDAAGMLQGLLHPSTGLDHVLAMVAVAWWAAVTQPKRWWATPLVFALATFAGAVAGAATQVALPGIELVIALSVVVFGALMLTSWSAPVRVAVLLATTLGATHGIAHGLELSGGTGAGGWLLGMAAGTLLLHAAGAFAGRIAAAHARWSTRVAGATTAAAGVMLLVGAA